MRRRTCHRALRWSFTPGLLLMLWPGLASAQTPQPYSVAGISAFAVASPARGALAQYYTSGTGGAFALTLPLERGTASLAASRVSFTGKAPAYNDFVATEALFGWSLVRGLGARVQLGAGVHAGEFMMAFDDTVINPGLRNEKELLLGATASGALRVAGPLAVVVQVGYDHVHLHVPTHFETAQAGLRYTAALPAWLSEFLH